MREEAKLRPELRDSVEPNVDSTDPVLEHTAAVSLSQKSNNPSVELKAGKGGITTDWIAASDEWDSTTSTLFAAASQTEGNAGTLSTDDWCEKTNSQSIRIQMKKRLLPAYQSRLMIGMHVPMLGHLVVAKHPETR